MTKEQEIDAFNAFLASLPLSSYLADYFREIAQDVADAIRNDLPIKTRVDLLENERGRINEQVKELHAEVSELEGRKREYSREINTLLRCALDCKKTISKTADDLHIIGRQLDRLSQQTI